MVLYQTRLMPISPLGLDESRDKLVGAKEPKECAPYLAARSDGRLSAGGDTPVSVAVRAGPFESEAISAKTHMKRENA